MQHLQANQMYLPLHARIKYQVRSVFLSSTPGGPRRLSGLLNSEPTELMS